MQARRHEQKKISWSGLKSSRRGQSWMDLFNRDWWRIYIYTNIFIYIFYTVAMSSKNIPGEYTRCLSICLHIIYHCIYYILYYIYCRGLGVKMLRYATHFSPNPKPPLKYGSFPVIVHCPRRSLGLGLTYLGRCKEHGTKWRFQGWIYQPVFMQCLRADIQRKPGRMKQHGQLPGVGFG